jgi:hypothetical protein
MKARGVARASQDYERMNEFFNPRKEYAAIRTARVKLRTSLAR